MSYLAIERETTLQTDDESGCWVLHTYQGKIKSKLARIGATPVKLDRDGGAKYILDFNQISFRAKSKGRNVSEEQRKAASERMKNLHKNKKEKSDD